MTNLVDTLKLFPVPVFVCQIDNHKKINYELEKYIYKIKNDDPEGTKKSNAGGVALS
jgi:hypothetical protein